MASIIQLAAYAREIEMFTYFYKGSLSVYGIFSATQVRVCRMPGVPISRRWLLVRKAAYSRSSPLLSVLVFCCCCCFFFLFPWCFFSLNHKAIKVKGKHFLHFNMVKLLCWCHQLWHQCRVSCVLCNIEMTQKYRFSIFPVLLAVK